MHIAVIYGSVRRERQGIRAARFMVNQLSERGHEVELVDPLEYPHPLLDLRSWEYEESDKPESIREVEAILDRADGYIVVSGEYNHAIPPALKNLLDHYLKQYRRKAVGIVTYSAGSFGGIRVVPLLREVFSNFSAITIPATLPISQVGKSFDEDGSALDEAYLPRAAKFLDEFEWCAAALQAAKNRENSP